MVASLAPLNYGLKHALARDAIVSTASRHVAPANFHAGHDLRSSRAFALGCGAPMARRSLRPHLNQIRGWVRQGRTDAWIAHQLEVTVQQIEAFKRENDLAPDGDGEPAGSGADFDDEIDLRAEDDALIAAELEAEQAEAETEVEEPGDD